MQITTNASFLPHDDPEASLAFYRDTLGFEVRNDVEYNGLHWITIGPSGQPDTAIARSSCIRRRRRPASPTTSGG